ncbi:DUF4268 domain-containing protein [Agrobacterium tumefaciens]|uniref:DUF4268 domain-containing protein n=2 Tax=Rhizobium/Agrobacterium group TaxID=227290 RepID=A0ABX8TDZ3_9HYPH|nr:DUF4268 domain-containing protein [Agrobacterium tumefaciens]QYA10824.1 DUF4268 domain-containing protein [Agrobacterium larrymoorei]
MVMYNLGKLEKIELRDIWISESSHFTPWLAREENLLTLSETLGLELELEAQERAVGPFRADILCKDIGTNTWVLIENQLERTDHSHLGQLLTYASGLEAVTIVWIAARFTEEHRSTLDWLNRITDETFRFFGVEVELWRIGESPAAPRFNIVSKPNNWNKLVTQAARAIDESELSGTKAIQLAYWGAFGTALMAKGGPLARERKPQPQSWMGYSIGRSGIQVTAATARNKRQIRAEIYISHTNAKAYFHLLHAQKAQIETELGYSLLWEDLPDGRDTRISIALTDTDPEDRSDWPRQHEWLTARLNEFHRVFVNRVKALDANAWQPSSDINP